MGPREARTLLLVLLVIKCESPLCFEVALVLAVIGEVKFEAAVGRGELGFARCLGIK